jgi:transcriptional regulator with XRE-family HTH domain
LAGFLSSTEQNSGICVYHEEKRECSMQKGSHPAVCERLERIQAKMRHWGITNTFLASQLGVSRQYAWQAMRGRIPVSEERATTIEYAVDTIIAQQKHIRSFGERLRAARIASGYTLKEVAALIGYSWVGVERWEKNLCRPKPGVLWHLFSLYGVDANPSLHSIRQEMPPPAGDVG